MSVYLVGFKSSEMNREVLSARKTNN